MTITLRPDLEEELAARARAKGMSTEEFINRELERLVIASTHPMSELTPEERVRRWDEWVNSHDYIKATPLSDEAISRESIYGEREDKQL